MNTGESEHTVCAIPSGALSRATSDSHTPRNGPTTAPATMNAYPVPFEPARRERASTDFA